MNELFEYKIMAHANTLEPIELKANTVYVCLNYRLQYFICRINTYYSHLTENEIKVRYWCLS